MRLVYVAFALIITSGCDKFYGPSIRVGYTSPITMAVYRSNGEISKSVLFPCQEVFTGAPDSKITQIVIYSAEQMVHRITKQQIQNMISQELSANGYGVWVLKEDGLYFTMAKPLDGCDTYTKSEAMNTVEQLKREIVVGTSEKAARAMLERHHIEYSYVPKSQIQVFDVPPKPVETYKALEGRLVAIIRNAGSSGGVEKNISIEIDISTDNKVSRIEFKPVYTAP